MNLITERITDRGRIAMLTWLGGILNSWEVLTILSFPPTRAEEPTAIIGFTPYAGRRNVRLGATPVTLVCP